MSIKEGMTFKNYKDLCEFLKQEIKTGESKIIQLKMFEKHFKFHKDGHKFIIDEVIDMNIPKNVRQNMYTQLMQKILLDQFISDSERENTRIKSYTINDLIRIANIANGKYIESKRNNQALSDETGISLINIKEFYTLTESKIYNLVTRALDKLEKDSLVRYNVSVMLKIRDDKYKVHIKANEKQLDILMDCEREVLLEMRNKSDLRDDKVPSKFHIVYRNEYDNFMDRVTKLFFDKTKIPVEYYYNVIEVHFGSFLAMERDRLEIHILKNERQFLRHTLNDKMVQDSKKQYTDRREKSIDEIYEDKEKSHYESDKLYRRASSEYVSDGHTLVDLLIKRN